MKVTKSDIKRICRYLGIRFPSYSGKSKTFYFYYRLPKNAYTDYLFHILTISKFDYRWNS